MAWFLDETRNLILESLRDGVPKFTKTFCDYLAEASAVCFESAGHQNGIVLHICISSEDEIFEVKYKVE